MKYLTNPEDDIKELKSLFGDTWETQTTSEISALYEQKLMSQISIRDDSINSLTTIAEAIKQIAALEKWYKILKKRRNKAALINEIKQHSESNQPEDLQTVMHHLDSHNDERKPSTTRTSEQEFTEELLSTTPKPATKLTIENPLKIQHKPLPNAYKSQTSTRRLKTKVHYLPPLVLEQARQHELHRPKGKK